MNKYLSIVEYRNQKILLANHQNQNTQEIIDSIKQTEQLIVKMNSDNILLIVDISNCEMNQEVVSQFKATAKIIRPFIKRAAVIGVKGVLKVSLIAINKFSSIQARSFNSLDEAKEWLTSK